MNKKPTTNRNKEHSPNNRNEHHGLCKTNNEPKTTMNRTRNNSSININRWNNRYRILENEWDSSATNTDNGHSNTDKVNGTINEVSDINNSNAGPIKSILKSKTNGNEEKHQRKVRFKAIRNNRNKRVNNKSKNKLKSLRILYANINGIKDKINSLELAAQLYGAHIIAVVETKQIPPRLDGYGIWKSKERKNRGGGGVAITARNDICSKISIVQNLEDDDQDVVWVELRKNQKEKVFIGTYYGKQESANRDEVEKEYDQLNTQINMLAPKGEIILTGDFNAKLEIKSDKYSQKISSNGKYLQNLIKTNKLQPVTTRKENVKWTRQNRNNPEEKSIIDYIITTEGIANHINEINIDEEGTYRTKGKKESDHNTILMEINISTQKEKKILKRWNLDNKEGWSEFNEKLKTRYENNDPQTHEELQSTIKSIMKKTVGQTTIRTGSNKPKESSELKQLRIEKKVAHKSYQYALKHNREAIPQKMKNYFKTQKDLKEGIEKSTKLKTQHKLEKMIKEGKLNAINFWKIKSKTEKSSEPELYDTITEEGIHLKNEEETKQYVASYFEDLYQARPGKAEYQQKTREIEEKVREIEKEMKNKPVVEEFTEEELVTAIKKLRRKKSTGPDEIPNELFIEADKDTKHIIMTALNKINKEMAIPQEWQKGEICRIYKSKGIKGKCSNERGITLSSNFGKLYERMINERVTPMVNISEAQAGGKRGSATVDHLLLMKELINAAKMEKKEVYIAYLDVAKAYDKAWLTGIMYVMYKEGLTDNHWTIVKRLNENLTAQLQTRFGLTREIKIKDSIRQGGVLSTTMYGLLMDEVSKNIEKEDMGIKIEGIDNKIGSLLWVDDVILITTKPQELQKSLDITDDTSNKYHVEYGQSKSNSQIIKHRKRINNQVNFKLGGMTLEQTEKYKYLGHIQNDKNNNEDHYKQLKGKIEAAYQKMIALTGNSNFSMIEMETIWKVVEACIIPIITYGGETWEMNKKTYKPVNQMLDNIIKRILKVPKSTPREPLYIETGLLDPETVIKKNRISMEARILKGNNKIMKQIIKLETKDCWAEQNKLLKEEIKLNNEDMMSSKYHLRTCLQNKMKELLEKKLTNTAEGKSKSQYYMEGKSIWKAGQRTQYLRKLNRNQASIIFKARTRMLKVKSNYKNGHKDLKCRLCGRVEENQSHILEECEILKDIPVITKEMIFQEEIEGLKEMAININKRMEKLEEINPNSTSLSMIGTSAIRRCAQ